MKVEATYADDFYRFLLPEENVEIKMENFKEKVTSGTNSLNCEIEVRSSDPVNAGLMHSGNWNLLTSSPQVNKQLRERIDIDWHGLFTQVNYLAKERYRQGEPIIDLATVEAADRARWLLPNFIEQTSRPTLIAAGGGTGKSTIGIAAAMSEATAIPFLGIQPEVVCPVLYLDWEADPEIHAERCQSLWNGAGLEGRFSSESLFYQRQVASLHQLVKSLKKKVIEYDIGFLVLDSVGMARGGAPEDAESTIQLFNAVRKLNLPVLAIDHMSKEALTNRNAKQSAIGSVYTENSVCRVWVMRSSDDGTGVTLEDVKRNHTVKQKTLAYNIHHVDDGTQDQRLVEILYESADFRDLDSNVQPQGQSNKWKMVKALKDNGGLPMSTKELSELSGVSEAVIRVEYNRNKDFFIKVDGKIALVTEAVQV